MLTTNDLLDRVKSRHGIPSDYQLAHFLKVTPASISKHRTKPHGMDDQLALRVAEAAGMAVEYVLVCAAVERAKRTQEKAAWLRLAAWVEMRQSEFARVPALD